MSALLSQVHLQHEYKHLTAATASYSIQSIVIEETEGKRTQDSRC